MSAYDYFAKTVDGVINPFMENKPAVMLLLALLAGTGTYTVLDLLGTFDPKEVEEKPVAVGKVIRTEPAACPEPGPYNCQCDCKCESPEVLEWLEEHKELH